jgi:hypothetical protein
MKGITFFLLLVSYSSLHSQPVTLRDTTNQYDYIIITVPEFVNACEPFRQHKETVRDFRTLIVDTTEIYAEFDSSATRQDNIREHSGKIHHRSFFLIVGTVSNVPNFPIPFQYIYLQSDYYYSQNIYENDSTTTDFYIGRIPAKTSTELNNYLSKVIAYENISTVEGWMNNSLFICADDINFEFFNAALEVSEHFANYIRPYFIVDTDTSIYYGNLDSIYSAIENRGTSMIWFEGHVSDSGFGNPNWFYLEELNELSNYNKYFLTFFASSQYSIIDSNTNFTNQLMFLSDAGSIGGIAFVGPAYWGTGQNLQHLWAERLFDQSIQSVGESFVSDDIPPSGLYNYMKKIANLWADPSLQLKYDTTVDVEKVEEAIPQSFTLYQNYPNPFNPATTIKFTLPVNSKVKINVYNSLGQLVETLVDREMESGYHEVNFNASKLASGIYLYQLQTGDYVSVKKMLLLK